MSKIDIGVSDKGQLSIGNLAQGREVNITTSKISNVGDSSSLIAELLNAVRESVGGNEILMKSVEGQIKELGEALSAENKDDSRITKILGIIKEHHGWAFPAIAAIVKRIFPAIGASL
jgi:hypothetical protein